MFDVMHGMSSAAHNLAMSAYLGSRDLALSYIQTTVVGALLIMTFLGTLILLVDTLLNRSLFNQAYSARGPYKYKLTSNDGGEANQSGDGNCDSLLYRAPSMSSHSGSRSGFGSQL